MSAKLQAKKIAIVATDGFEQVSGSATFPVSDPYFP
jgi:hypothetical protein